MIEYSKLAQREYKRRHGNVVRMVNWKLFENFNFEKSGKWYLQNPQTVTENVNQILIWDMNIQCENVIVERKPDFFISNKMENTAIIVDAAITLDNRILTRKWKIKKNQNIRGEIQRLWNLWNFGTFGTFAVLLLVLVALRSVTKNIAISVDKIGIKIYLHTVQESTLLGTARI